MNEYRCRKCGRLLFRSNAERGQVQAVCADRRCRTLQVVTLGDRRGLSGPRGQSAPAASATPPDPGPATVALWAQVLDLAG